MPNYDIERLRAIKTFPSLIKYLRDELDWPIDQEKFDDLTFDYEPEELGLDPKTAVKVKEIKQLRPLVGGQPWGIFFINFEPKRLPVVALRRILQALVVKKRVSANRSQQASWQLHDLLFISAYGETEHRDLTFAHFADDPKYGDLPTLHVLGWDDEDTVLHLGHAHAVLREKLHWPANTKDIDLWRKAWSSAFTIRHREVITTAKDMSIQLAELATRIRKRANRVLAVESEKGPLRKLYKAFKESLIHDLSDDQFADMYAQTISYGLLTARVSRPLALVAEDAAAMVPVTNPFLKELLETFVSAGGRKARMDFDELGINEVVATLREANMEAVLRDFGDKNPQEDPVIHFYELFLKEYDAHEKIKRGVFYTPRPVVSYIVRSVDELLRTELGLADGLADTATWEDMKKSHKDLIIPQGITTGQDFIQILDPAIGTGTFLVEVIDVIHKTLVAKWRAQGYSDEKIDILWNEYVPKHLLTRLYGYELLMAPYAIAHMKIGLKLYETGYRFNSDERVRVYLTNTLEPASNKKAQLEVNEWMPALAHEAVAVNQVKKNCRFTVVVGNPPYSGISSNTTEYALRIVDAYKIIDGAALEERKLWLQDDYVKFIRNAQTTIETTHVGILGYITNHGYLDNPTFRGMRQSILSTFPRLRVIDLHGNTNKKERAPDGSEDINVFDIRQGVGVCLATSGKAVPSVEYAELWGTRESKYQWLATHIVTKTPFVQLKPDSPYYFFKPHCIESRAEYDKGWRIPDIFPLNTVGFVTARDSLTIQMSANEVWDVVNRFVLLTEERARAEYDLGKDARDWRVTTAQKDIRESGQTRKLIHRILYRPFDFRFTYYTGNSRGFYASPCSNVMKHMIAGTNLALCFNRREELAVNYTHFLASRLMTEHGLLSSKTTNYQAPLYLIARVDDDSSLFSGEGMRPNISSSFLSELAKKISLRQEGEFGLPTGLTPEDIFHYAYAVFYSPGYRSRYAELLKIDFPRLPLTSNLDLFHALSKLGGKLVALHIMETPNLSKQMTEWVGSKNPEVEKISYSDQTVWIDKSQSEGFRGVPVDVWNFHIGGYQVCEKWLKDRKGRRLSKDDIEHYQKIVVALSETIHIMGEIDKVIEKHGGWPGAFK